MKRIKVLHIIKTLGLGGAEHNLLNLVSSLDAAQFEIHVTYSGDGELEEQFKARGIKLFKFAKEAHKLKSLTSLAIIWRLMRYMRKNKIDIVHTHTFNAHVWGSMAAKLAGVKILEHVHDSRYMDPDDFRRRGETSTQYRFVKFLKNISDLVIVLTRQNQEFIWEQKLHPKERVIELQNGIDLNQPTTLSHEARIALRAKIHIPADAPVVLTPIRFSPEKNLDVLRDILCDVVKAMPNAICIIAGSGPEKEAFEGAIKMLGKENNIRTIGYYPNIPELLNITQVFLLPSTIELHSIAILEAMRQKVPVVASAGVGCNDEFIFHWKNGILLDPFTKDRWADAIVKLLQDDALRQKIGQAGYVTVADRFDIRDIADKLEGYYVRLAHI